MSMNSDVGQTWALVLAAGEGSRLRCLTTTVSGIAVPKQFCSLRGGRSLLQETIGRAASIVDHARICTVVAEQHRSWWGPAVLWRLPQSNVIVQPENRGTGNGVLLPLLHIMERDPEARIVILPSDHHVCDESVLRGALDRALAQLARGNGVVLLGVEPEGVDPELGYIVPHSDSDAGVYTVDRFVEKPSTAVARELIAAGALWNVFIVAARAPALLDLFSTRYPKVVADMRVVVADDAENPTRPVAATRLYRSLPFIDFSRHVTEGCESALRVLRVPPCGWSDLGTPVRLARALSGIRDVSQIATGAMLPVAGTLNLAARHALLQSATLQAHSHRNLILESESGLQQQHLAESPMPPLCI